MHKTSTAADFIRSDNPVGFLGTFHEIVFTTPACETIAQHASTDEEVGPLMVLSLSDGRWVLCVCVYVC